MLSVQFEKRLNAFTEAFDECCSIFGAHVCKACNSLDDAYASFLEETDIGYVSEKASESLSIKIKKIIANLMTAVENFINSIKIHIETATTSSNYQKNLRKLHEELKEKKSQGVRKVSVQDVWSLRDIYLEGSAKLQKYVKKFANMQYKTTAELEKDLDTFNSIYDEYDKKAQGAIDKRVTVPIDKMLAFVEAECSGNGRVVSSMTSAMKDFKEMGNAANTLAKKAETLGPDIIQKHVGFIKRQIMKITGFMKKWIVKFIATMCIIIG